MKNRTISKSPATLREEAFFAERVNLRKRARAVSKLSGDEFVRRLAELDGGSGTLLVKVLYWMDQIEAEFCRLRRDLEAGKA